MRDDRARQSLGRHATYIVTAILASGRTSRSALKRKDERLWLAVFERERMAGAGNVTREASGPSSDPVLVARCRPCAGSDRWVPTVTP